MAKKKESQKSQDQIEFELIIKTIDKLVKETNALIKEIKASSKELEKLTKINK